MFETGTAKLFMHGRSQAVRLPKDFRMPGTEVRVRRVGRGVMLEPMTKMTPEEIQGVFDELETYRGIPFMENGREQPAIPDDDDLPSFD